MLTALCIWNEILRRTDRRGQSCTVTRMQKLAYFAHGWHLALSDGQPLIPGEPFEAWRFGPAMPGHHRAFSCYGNDPIPLDHPLSKTPPVRDDVGDFIERILDVYGDYTPYELVGLSHDPEGPWYKIYHDPSVSAKIPDVEIWAYFRSKMNERGQNV